MLTEMVSPMRALYVCVRKGSGSTLGRHTDHRQWHPSWQGKGHPITFLCRHKGLAELTLVPINHLVLEKRMWSVPGSSRFILAYNTALYTRLGVGVSKDHSGRLEKSRSPLRFYRRIFQPGVSSYNFYPTPSTLLSVTKYHFRNSSFRCKTSVSWQINYNFLANRNSHFWSTLSKDSSWWTLVK
jgi:hypothetical protein